MALIFALFLVFTHYKKGWNVLVIGGAGYIGSALVPKLLARGHTVTVLDLYPYGREIFSDHRAHMKLRQVAGDFRDPKLLADALSGCDVVIHLACVTHEISPDPDPDFVNSINSTAFRPLVRAVRTAGIKRFLFASSYTVYGDQGQMQVSEDLEVEPPSVFAKNKVSCEIALGEERTPGFITCIVRAAAVCGPAPSQRPGLIVNGLTNDALTDSSIRIPPGTQVFPNIHIDDITDLYLLLLNQPDGKIDGKTYNAGAENLTLTDLAEVMETETEKNLKIHAGGVENTGSCHLLSEKLRRELGFSPKHTVAEAVRDLVARYRR